MDLFVVPTLSFRLLYGLLILQHDRRQIVWLGVTAHPTAEWISHQLTEAYGWKVAPRYIIRDRDCQRITVSGLTIFKGSSTPGASRYNPANTRRSMLVKVSRRGDLRLCVPKT